MDCRDSFPGLVGDDFYDSDNSGTGHRGQLMQYGDALLPFRAQHAKFQMNVTITGDG